MSNYENHNLVISLDSMKASNLEGFCKIEGLDSSYNDIPDLITDIKQELLSQNVSEAIITIREEECELNAIAKKEENKECWVGSGAIKFEEVNLHSKDEDSVAIKKEGNKKECWEGSNFIKFEEVDIKSEDEEDSQANSAKKEAKKKTSSFASIDKLPRVANTFKCYECDYQTKRKYDLKTHIIRHHKTTEQVDLLKCLKCDFQTKWKSCLNKHVLSLHKSTETFQCIECDYKTLFASSLERHVFRHRSTGEVNINKCMECDYQTECPSNFKRHLLRHKSIEEVEMHKCLKCDFQTKRRDGLTKHVLRLHEYSARIQCLECDYQTVCPKNLKRHVLRHKNAEEVEIYKCPKCDFQTRWKDNVIKHIRRRHKSTTQVAI